MQQQSGRWLGLSALIAAALALAVPTLAQNGEQGDSAGANESTTTNDAAEESGEVMRQLLEQRDDERAVPSQRDSADEDGEDAEPSRPAIDMPTAEPEADESVLGPAPGQGESEGQLRREGDFIVERRGHLARAEDSNRLLFVFEADDKQSAEPPMILQPCKTLQTMERIVQQRGERVQFVLSGQVHTYRGRNYLLPTMMKIAERTGSVEE